jgi:hypothetical protein
MPSLIQLETSGTHLSSTPCAHHYADTTCTTLYWCHLGLMWWHGGLWLMTLLTADTQPCIRCSPFLQAITDKLVSWDNPNGHINNSELELVPAILGHTAQLAAVPWLGYTYTDLGTDNTPTQTWTRWKHQHSSNDSLHKTAAYLMHAWHLSLFLVWLTPSLPFLTMPCSPWCNYRCPYSHLVSLWPHWHNWPQTCI